MNNARTGSNRLPLLLTLMITVSACATNPEVFPDTTPLIVVALETSSFASAVKAAQKHKPSMRTGIKASVAFDHLSRGEACPVLIGPNPEADSPVSSSPPRLSANNADGYRRAYEGAGVWHTFRSNGVLDYWGGRTFENGRPELGGYIFAAKEAFHAGEDAYQLSRLSVSGYALGALTSSGGRDWKFDLPAARPAVTFAEASIVFIGPLRLVAGENDTITAEWIETSAEPFVEAIAQASGRPVEAIVPAQQYIIDSQGCG